MDSFSPLSAARMLVQVLPIGPVTPDVFNTTLKKLQETGPVQLGDISPPPESDRSGFNPLGFPRGKISFSFTPSSKSLSHAVLYPFETFREPFVVLGIVDGSKFDLLRDAAKAQITASTGTKRPLVELKESLAQVKDNYPNALIHRLLIVEEDASIDISPFSNQAMLLGPKSKTGSLLCDLAALALQEMAGLAKSFQALQTYPSPLSQTQDVAVGDSGPDGASAPSRRASLRPGISPKTSSQDAGTAHRMSMPPYLMSSASSTSGDRLGTPSSDGKSTPATTFDDIPGATPRNVGTRISAPPVQSGSRDPSRDRNSSPGFGSGALGERNRMKQQGRLASIVGSLYLQSGLWSDAFRELTDSAIKARSCSDHLWHAKALENLISCMVLLASNGVGFKIPDICYPSSNRPLAARGQQILSSGITDVATPKPEDVIEAMRALYELLPELIHMIRDSYRRTLDIPGEFLPTFAYSEINIRFARLLIGLSDREHMDEAMKQLMRGDPNLVLPSFNRGRAIAWQTNDILQNAVPRPSDFTDVSMLDTLFILGAVAASYAAINMARKSALVLQDFLDCLVPGLVQARKVGAAEAGMHPAAGIANLQSQVRHSEAANMRFEDILNFFECVDLLPRSDTDEQSAEYQSIVIRKETISNIDTKLSLLRKGIRVCEALPDFDGMLKCTAQLFALAGPASAPPLAHPDVSIMLPSDEQTMLSGNFYRTSDLIENLSLPREGGNYWDPFLIRGIEIKTAPPAREMISRRMADFGDNVGQSSISRGPFLHDAFAQKNKAKPTKPVLVAGENVTFWVTLQNLFDFDTYIDKLELVTDTDGFMAKTEGIRVSPRSVQTFSVTGMPKTPGNIKITGCRVAPKGCREKLFKVYPGTWTPEEAIKIGEPSQKLAKSNDEQPFELEAIVLEPQPMLTVAEFSLSQRALDIMEGERKRIKLALCDRTSSSTVNLIKLTPQDNIKLYLQSTLKERDIQPSFRHEMERQLFHNPALYCVAGEEQQSLPPKEQATFEFEVFGKPGLTHGSIQVDYGAVAESAKKGSFFTRVIEIPFTVAVKPSMQLLSCHIAPLPHDPMGVLPPRSSNCWLTLDFKNMSSQPLELAFTQRSDNSTGHRPKLPIASDQKDMVPADRLTSLSRTTAKLYVEDPHAIIPSLDPTKERQFVLRTSGGAPVDERAERERFWYNSKLIESLSASWVDPKSGRNGSVDLHGISLTSDEVDLLRLNEVSVTWISDFEGSVGEISIAKFKIVNRGKEALRAEFQLYRTVDGFDDRLAGSHVEMQMLSVLKPDGETEIEFKCTFENPGHHVFMPSIIEREDISGDISRRLRTWRGETKYVTIT